MGTRHDFVCCFIHSISLRRIDMPGECLLPESPRKMGREIHAEKDGDAGRRWTSRKPEEVCSCLRCWVELVRWGGRWQVVGTFPRYYSEAHGIKTQNP